MAESRVTMDLNFPQCNEIAFDKTSRYVVCLARKLPNLETTAVGLIRLLPQGFSGATLFPTFRRLSACMGASRREGQV